MNQIKWPMLVYAILAAVCIMGIGIAIGEQSIIGAILCVVGCFVIMGLGFKTKKKLREEGKL
ncbi:MAG: YlaF family protein [Bacillus sp. (in: firmicutes)]|jgi:arginine exporter protein ArgO|uniref:YlaF family protein n=1 Tax=Bacillus sp. SORGH_AS_0510 TaxID=3041771 RepID=UPI0027877A15|nr:YlaF family protein [Bacillus sp. SORGH_AS_0510]MDQ1146858.1 arginine exporter protein ArgO [Bacillus sp. SORGH_AS_0510]